MDIWQELGFRENFYRTTPVPASDEGARLLVGRESELRRLTIAIASSANHVTIEGDNGVGKTSLVSIAAYNLHKAYLSDPVGRPLFVPMSHIFQISPDVKAERFTEHFLIKLAAELLARSDIFNLTDSNSYVGLNRWLNDPVITGVGGGVSGLGFGASASVSRSANTSVGFARAGLETHLQSLLRALFPEDKGGIICLIDNLELLETSTAARLAIEELRDGILSFPGVRWVLCGARGIVRSVASTERMAGKLMDPLELGPLGPEDVRALIERRVREYSNRSDTYVPVDGRAFAHIYEVGNRNLRISLKYCEDFVFWLFYNGARPAGSEEKAALLEAWFAELADKYSKDTLGVGQRAWEVFDGIAARPDGISPSDAGDLGFNSPQAMQKHLRALEHAQLIQSVVDESDNRRKTIFLTSRGWVVRYKRKGYVL